MKQTPLVFALCLFVLSGCVQNSIREFGKLTPTDTGFEATLGVNDTRSPVNDREAEADRLQSLEDWAADAGLCPNGYRIIDRTVVQRLGYEYWISYKGACL